MPRELYVLVRAPRTHQMDMENVVFPFDSELAVRIRDVNPVQLCGNQFQ